MKPRHVSCGAAVAHAPFRARERAAARRRIGQVVRQRDLAVTANTYSHVMIDEIELDYEQLLTG